MRIPTIATAVLAPAGIMCTASGFMKSCSRIGLTNLEGDPGRSIMLQAYCKVGDDDHWTQLDLKTCFGWSADTCNFIPPQSSDFTDSCTKCYTSTGGFDGTFGCRGPCNAGGEVFKMFNLGTCMISFAPSFIGRRGPSLLTRTLADSYVGNLVGNLIC